MARDTYQACRSPGCSRDIQFSSLSDVRRDIRRQRSNNHISHTTSIPAFGEGCIREGTRMSRPSCRDLEANACRPATVPRSAESCRVEREERRRTVASLSLSRGWVGNIGGGWKFNGEGVV